MIDFITTHGLTAFRRLPYADRIRAIKGELVDPPPPPTKREKKEIKQKQAEHSERVKARSRREPPKSTVGTEFKKMAEQLVNQKLGCGCETMAAKLNSLTVAECRERIDDLTAEIQTNKKAFTWIELAKAAVLGATHLFEWHLDPLNPIRSMLVESIRRAEYDNKK